MEKNCLISVVIPNHNGIKHLKDCLPSVIAAREAAGVPVEIIVVDDNSSDGSLDFLQSGFRGKIKPLRNPRRGACSARNFGVSETVGEYLLFIDNDVFLEKDFFVKIGRYLSPGIFCITCAGYKAYDSFTDIIDQLDGIKLMTWERGFPRFTENIFNETLKCFPVSRDNKGPFFSYGVQGAYFLCSREKFDILGGFDELFDPYLLEETDFMYRGLKRGWEIIYAPDTTPRHKHGGTIHSKTSAFTGYLSRRNRELFVWKNITDRKLLFLHILWMFRSLGVLPFILKHRKEIIRKRKEQLSHIEVSDGKLLHDCACFTGKARVYRELYGLEFELARLRQKYAKRPDKIPPRILIYNIKTFLFGAREQSEGGEHGRKLKISSLFRYISYRVEKNTVGKQLRSLLTGSVKPFILYLNDSFSFSSPLFQRPQHVFLEFAKAGYIVLWPDKDVREIVCVEPNIYLFPLRQLGRVMESRHDKILDVYAHGVLHDMSLYDKIKDDTVIMLEYVDDFDLIKKKKEKKDALGVYHSLIRRPRTLVFATAEKLYRRALEDSDRKNNVFLNKNAVRLTDFVRDSVTVPAEMNKIKDRKKPVIGYYGALSDDWFDFDLAEEVINSNRDMEFVFIGFKMGRMADALEKYPNYTFISAVPYKELKNYAACFDVAVIPFANNEITSGTSPVKLFEYMALGLPIVTTDMPECRLYRSCLTANNARDFSAQLKKALKLKNNGAYQAILKKEAKENTWSQRVSEMIKQVEAVK